MLEVKWGQVLLIIYMTNKTYYNMKEFLNKMHYGIFYFLLDQNERDNKLILKITPQKYKDISKRNIMNSRKFYYDKKEGFTVLFTHHLFGGAYASYFLFFSGILLGIKDVFFDVDNKIVTLLLIGLPILVGYIPAYKAVLSNDVYLNYYKKFEKKDARWQRKCKWMAVAFCIGGFLTMILGLFAYSFIVEYMKS